jgi:hypothetical protein
MMSEIGRLIRNVISGLVAIAVFRIVLTVLFPGSGP